MNRIDDAGSREVKTVASHRLERVVGVPGAVMLGLGSILGTGIFVSISIAAGIAGDDLVLAVVAAAVVAAFNGLSSAQLAAAHPVSGGTYEYGYRLLSPALGFTAGWMFLCAKSASAATAALGAAGYLLPLLGVDDDVHRVVVAVVSVVASTALVGSGARRSNGANAVIVTLTLGALLAFIIAGLANASFGMSHGVAPRGSGGNFLHATALMFVAYTGYGRIATLGEEVREPRRSIPRAIVVTLVTTAALYAAVAFVATGAVGAEGLAAQTSNGAAPLEAVARGFGVPGLVLVVSVGAVTAMLGVLLNLILGLSRVVLAMARRADAPEIFARVHAKRSSPVAAVWLIGALVTALAATGSVKTTWSFSAFTVLIYYAITNLAALRLPASARRYPRWISVAGLACCLGLAFWVELRVWGVGLILVAVGLGWHWLRRGRSVDIP